ncbi:MAG: LacI family DNA-binding transcriptional regulator [Anaerolineae bacterium]|nr:LacI family DNA-binding transcriptional regulator [Anaerolineae bacterium]
MTTTPKHATIRDVAQRSGVSSQTVSRVINGNIHVSAKTRNRVLKAIEELNFRPNRAAQSLVTRRSGVLEIITFGTTHYGPAQMVAHVQTEAKALGYNLIFSSIDDVTLAEIRAVIDNLSGRLVDGIVMIMPVFGTPYDELTTLLKGIPCVWIDVEQGANIPSVVIDQGYGSRLATQHLLDLGHRQICEISGPLRWVGAVARSRSWRATLDTAGVPPCVSIEGDWTSTGGYAAAKRLLDMDVSFTALVVGNDQMALGAIHALDEQGIRVPDDVSVVGFDDIPEAAHFKPPLTTIRQDFTALGKQSVEYLVSLINKPDTALHQRVITPQLVLRSSTRDCRR